MSYGRSVRRRGRGRLAGGLTGAGDTLVEPVRARTRAALAWRPPPPIEISPSGAHAGTVGAAVLAWSAAGYDEVARTWTASALEWTGEPP